MNTKLITVAALGLALSAGAVANPADDRGTQVRHLDRLTERLDLSDAQRTEVKALMDAHHEEMKRAREAMHAELRALLTPEQAAKLDAMHARRDEHKRKDKDDDEERSHRHGDH